MKIVLIDDHPLFREGVKKTLSQNEPFKVVGEASSIESAKILIKELTSDISNIFFVIDISLPDGTGFELLPLIEKNGGSKTQCVILSMHDEPEYAEHTLEVGASGYVVKSDNPDCLIDCLNSLDRGQTYFSESIHKKNKIHRTKKTSTTEEKDVQQLESLSKRELAVLKLVAQEKTSKEISESLFLSQRTVENHRAKICSKLGVSGAHGLIAYAIKNKAAITASDK